MDFKRKSSLFVFLHYMLGFHNLTCQISGSLICKRRNEQTKKNTRGTEKGERGQKKYGHLSKLPYFHHLLITAKRGLNR